MILTFVVLLRILNEIKMFLLSSILYPYKHDICFQFLISFCKYV